MSGDIVERVLRSARYRDVDRSLVRRLAGEEMPKARNADDAVKRAKRRLHQVVGAFRGAGPEDPIAAAWSGDHRPGLAQRAPRCSARMPRPANASRTSSGSMPASGGDRPAGARQRSRLRPQPHRPAWMRLDPGGDVPRVRRRSAVARRGRPFLDVVGQPHRAELRDVVTDLPADEADVALLLKLVPTLDRQDPKRRRASCGRCGRAMRS